MPVSSSPFSPRLGLSQREELIRRFGRQGRKLLQSLWEEIPEKRPRHTQKESATWDEAWAEPLRDAVGWGWSALRRLEALLGEATRAAALGDLDRVRVLASALKGMAKTGLPGQPPSPLTVGETEWWWPKICDLYKELQACLQASARVSKVVGHKHSTMIGMDVLALLEDAQKRWELDALPADHLVQDLMPTWLALHKAPGPWPVLGFAWLQEVKRLKALTLTSFAERVLAETYKTSERTARRVVRQMVAAQRQRAEAARRAESRLRHSRPDNP